jgi:hypothetical protein
VTVVSDTEIVRAVCGLRRDVGACTYRGLAHATGMSLTALRWRVAQLVAAGRLHAGREAGSIRPTWWGDMLDAALAAYQLDCPSEPADRPPRPPGRALSLWRPPDARTGSRVGTDSDADQPRAAAPG